MRFYGLLGDEVELLEKWHPGEFIITPERDIYDYIYETERLTTIAGNKLHGNRGHIHRFEENHDWRYESLGPDNSQACLQMNQIWKRKRADKWDPDMEEEFQVVNQALQHYDKLGMVGGVLWADREVVAFTMGESHGVYTLAVHFE